MPDPRYPAAQWMPGANAGYAAGRTPVRSVVCHYTVGRNSTGIGLQGYYQFQVNRDGTVFQFAEADGVCWHAGSPWNALGPGIEVEYLPGADDDLWTPEQREATARLVEWLHDEWGVPYDFYDGPRKAAHLGFITHRSLIQTGDQHSDWWPELPRTTPPPPEEDDMKGVFCTAEGIEGVWYVYAGTRIWCKTKAVVDHIAIFGWATNGWDNPTSIPAEVLKRFPVIGDTP